MPKRSEALAVLGLAAFAVALHALLAVGVPGPSLLWDGTAYLSLARWVAGEHAPDLGHLGHYHLGYPILLAPVVWVTGSLDGLFDGVRAVNALAAGVAAVALAVVARRLFGASRPAALLAAAAGVAYPGMAMQSGLEWAEVVLTALTWTAVVAHQWAFDQPSGRRLAVPALVVAAAYLVHPTGLVLVVASALVLATVRARRAAAGGLAVLVAGTLGAWALNRWALAARWSSEVSGQSSQLAGTAADPGTWGDLAVRALGTLWYVSVASFGLAALGVAAVVHLLRHGYPAPRRTAAWIALAATGSLALTALKFPTAARPDHLAYGRYVDAFVPLLVVGGITFLAASHRRRVAVAGAGVAVAGLAGWIVVAAVDPAAFRGVTMPANLFGILALDGASASGLDVGAVSLIAAAVAAIVLVVHLGWAWPAATATVVLAAFVTSDVLLRDDVRAFSADAQRAFQLADVLDLVDPDAAVAVDRAVFDVRGVNRYRLVEQDRTFTVFDSRRGEVPASDLVVAGQDPAAPPVEGARAVFPEPNHEQLLWVGPGELQDDLARRGVLLARPGDALPDAFFDGTLTLVGAGDGTVEVDVSKTGGGAAWARADSAPGIAGAVDVEVVVDGVRATARLPRTMYPGETLRVSVPVEGVSAGIHALRARLVVDGAQGFAGIVGNLRFP